jgi:hypothetical protein
VQLIKALISHGWAVYRILIKKRDMSLLHLYKSIFQERISEKTGLFSLLSLVKYIVVLKKLEAASWLSNDDTFLTVPSSDWFPEWHKPDNREQIRPWAGVTLGQV